MCSSDLRDLRLDQVLPLPEPATQDLLSDAVGGILGQRPRSGEWTQPDGALTHAAERNTVLSTVDQ